MQGLAKHGSRLAGHAGRRPRRPRGRRRPGPAARCYLGARRRPFFWPRRTQEVQSLSRVVECLGGGAMLLGMASWGLVLALLAR